MPEPHARPADSSSDPNDHPLVTAVEQKAQPLELLRLVQRMMARRSATLAFMAQNAEHFDIDDGRAVTREVRMLRRFGELVVAEHRALGPQPLPPDHPLVRQVVGLLLERVVEVGHEVLPGSSARALEEGIRRSVAADPELPWP